MRITKKVKREITRALSKVNLKTVNIDYLGKIFTVPLIQGCGAEYCVLSEDWMSECIGHILKAKQGAVVDIGANVGFFLVKTKALDAARHYYGFEPNTLCVYYLQDLIKLNGFTHAQFFPFALSDKEEIRTFYARQRADKMGSLNEFVRRDSHRTERYDFDVITRIGDEVIELLSPARIALIKIDIANFNW